MRAFIPSNPQDRHRSQIEIMNWEAEIANKKAHEQRETRRFIITTLIASIAAVASVVAATASIISCLR